MIRVIVFENAGCLKCNAINKYMVKIGEFSMCGKCAKEEFPAKNSTNVESFIPEGSDKYKFWLNKYKEFV